MASTTSWDESVPSGTSSIAQGDDDIRSLKSFVRSWISQEHYTTDGSATSAGEHKLGSARAFQLPLSQISGVANRTGQISHDTTNNYLWVGSGSSISQIAGAAVGSVNTWTARQAFTGNVRIGSATTSNVSAVYVYSAAFSVYTLAGSGATSFGVGGVLDSALSNSPAQMSLALPQNSRCVHSAYYDSTNDLLVANISNLSTVQVVIPAQTIRVIVTQIA